jgi:hypothetical protein
MRPDHLLFRPPGRIEQRSVLALQSTDLDAPEGSVALRPPERLCRPGRLALRLVARAG